MRLKNKKKEREKKRRRQELSYMAANVLLQKHKPKLGFISLADEITKYAEEAYKKLLEDYIWLNK